MLSEFIGRRTRAIPAMNCCLPATLYPLLVRPTDRNGSYLEEVDVVDRYGFAHEVPNLGVLSGSVMRISGAHNPTLTAQALPWRMAERLKNNWRTMRTEADPHHHKPFALRTTRPSTRIVLLWGQGSQWPAPQDVVTST